MPLIKSGSKKAFKHNVEVEMAAHPDKKAQDLAIAYSVKRKNMAKGGQVTAKTESRPMPDMKADDAHMVAQNDHKHNLPGSKMLDQPTLPQARHGMKTTPIKHPKMVPSTGYSAKLRDQEDNLQKAGMVNNGPQIQPKTMYNEKDANKHGIPPHPMKRMAKGGMINDEVSFNEAEEDMDQHPAMEESDNDQMAPAKDEYMADHFADGGEVDAHEEEALEHHASIVAAIMAKRAAKEALHSGSEDMDHAEMMAEGGEVYLDENEEEMSADPSSYDDQNIAAMKENYDEDMDDADQPMDSNEHGDSEEEHAENKKDHSIIAKIMSRKKKSPITR